MFSDIKKFYNFYDLSILTNSLLVKIKSKIIDFDDYDEKDTLSDTEVSNFVEHYLMDDQTYDNLSDSVYKDLYNRLTFAHNLFLNESQIHPNLCLEWRYVVVLMCAVPTDIWRKKSKLTLDKSLLEKFYNTDYPIYLRMLEKFGLSSKKFYKLS